MEKCRILIVEDEPVVALDLKRELESLGHEVVGIAASGEAAIEIFEKTTPDILLQDIRLEGALDGVATAARLKDRKPDLPIVFLTAYADVETVGRVALTEPQAYIVKPFQASELRATIEIIIYKLRAQKEREHGQSRFHEGNLKSRSLASTEEVKEALDQIATLPIFSHLTPEQIDLLKKESTIQRCKSQESLFQEGDPSPPPFFVIRGKVAMAKISSSGKEHFADLIFPGDMFGIISIGDDLPSAFHARCQSDALVLLMPRTQLRLFLSENDSFRRDFERYLSLRLREASEITRAVAHDKVEQRLAAILLTFLTRSLPPPGHTAGDVIWITRQELCSLGACTLETSIRATRAMEDAGLLDLSQRGSIRVLNVSELSKIAGLENISSTNSVKAA